MSRASRYRACPLCEAICGLEFQYQGDQLVAIRGDADDPFSGGHICPKGNAILDLESDPDRVRKPMRRAGDRWHEIGWDEAIELAGTRLAAIQSEHGAAALGVYLGNPNAHHFGHIAYLPNLLKLLRTPNLFSASSVDQWPHQLVAAQMFGHQFLLPIADVDNTDYFLMLGANPVASMGSLMTAPGIVKRLKKLTERGRLVVVDPRRSETAQIASEHVFIKPGSDALFLIGILRSLLALGKPRIERYAEKLNGLDIALNAIADFDLDTIATRSGVERTTIERIAAELHAAPRAVVYGRTGVSIQSFGTLAQWLIQLLNLVTGNLDAIGGALPNDAAIPLTGPGTATGQRGRWSSRVRGLPEFGGELPVAALCEEITTPGAGQIRALLTVAGNPVLSTPNGKALEAALPQLDFHVAIDIYINETTRFADLILPPASSLTQPNYDLLFNAFAVRRVARWSAPLREMAANERADWQVIDGLGQAYAIAAGRDYTSMPPPDVIVANGLKRGNSGLDFDTLRNAEHGIDLGPLHPCLLDRLQTASGKIECAPRLFLDDLQRLRELQQDRSDNAALQLIGRRDIRSNNSWMHNAPRLIKGKTRHHLWMHPDDLAARGLTDGARVRMRSRVGTIDVDVQAHDAVMRGVVCLPHGFGHARRGVQLDRASALSGESYNDLSDPLSLDAPSGNAALNGLQVWVETIP